MKINKPFRPDLLVSKEPNTPALQYVLFEQDPNDSSMGTLTATNGFSIASFPVTDCQNDYHRALIPSEVFERLTKSKRNSKYGYQLSVTKENTIISIDGVEERYCNAESEVTFPNWRKAIPDWSVKETIDITFDVELLLNLSKAIANKTSRHENHRVTLRVILNEPRTKQEMALMKVMRLQLDDEVILAGLMPVEDKWA